MTKCSVPELNVAGVTIDFAVVTFNGKGRHELIHRSQKVDQNDINIVKSDNNVGTAMSIFIQTSR